MSNPADQPVSPVAASPAARRPRRRPARLGGYAIAGTLVLVVAGAYITLLFGRVTGSEFSPEAFERRSFRYWQIPVIRIQVSGVHREPMRGRLENYLLTNNLLTAQPAKRWDLIEATEGATTADPRGASIAVDYLAAQASESASYWESWSTAYPERARWLWPEFAQLARRRLYTIIPDLMTVAHASSETTLDQFYKQLHRTLARRYGELAALQRRGGNGSAARQLETWGRRHADAARKPAPAEDE